MHLYIVCIYADFYIYVLTFLYWYKIYLYADLKFVQKKDVLARIIIKLPAF